MSSNYLDNWDFLLILILLIKTSAFFQILGIEDLFVYDDGSFYSDSNSSLGLNTEAGEYEMKSLHVQSGGTFELFSIDKQLNSRLTTTNLTVGGNGEFFRSIFQLQKFTTAFVKSVSRIIINIMHILTISSVFNSDHLHCMRALKRYIRNWDLPFFGSRNSDSCIGIVTFPLEFLLWDWNWLSGNWNLDKTLCWELGLLHGSMPCLCNI